MADSRALTIQGGVWKQIADADSVIVGAGIKTAGVIDLTIVPGGTNVTIGAGKTFNAAAGAGIFNFGSATGAFTTSTGANTLSGDTSVASGKSLSSAGGAADFNWSASSGQFKTGTGAVEINGSTTVASATSITSAGGAADFDWSASSGTFKTGTGAVSLNGDSTLAAGKHLLLSTSSRLDTSAAGTLLIGTTGSNSTAITIGRSGVTTTIAGDLTVTGAETVNGSTTFSSSVTFGDVTAPNPDVVRFATSATPGEGGAIGDATYPDMPFTSGNAHVIYVHKSGTAGTAGTDLSMQAGYGDNGSGATPGGAGATLTLKGGNGGDGTGSAAAGVGGVMVITAGSAGANGGGGGAAGGAITAKGGNASGTAASGAAMLRSGDASTGLSGNTVVTTGTTGGNGGDINIIHGSTSGTKGSLNMGTTADTGAINIGISGITTTVLGALTVTGTTNAVSITTTSGAYTLSSSGAAITITAAASSTWSTTSGFITVKGVTGVALNEGATTLLDAGNTTTGRVTVTGGFTQGSGTFVITGNAASSLTTSSGDLNITAAGQLKLDGTSSGISLKAGGTELMSIASGSIQIKNAGTVFSAAAGTIINLHNDGRWQINGSNVASTFDATATAVLTNGSNADSYHVHAAGASAQTVIAGLTTTGLADGDLGYISASDTAVKAIATAMSTAIVIGANEGTSGSMTVAGVIENQNVEAGITILAGERLYLSDATAGTVTNVAPSASGSVIAPVGVAKAGNGGAGNDVKMILQILPPVQIP